MDTERFIGDTVMVSLTISEIIEDKDGIAYRLVGDNPFERVLVRSDKIIKQVTKN